MPIARTSIRKSGRCEYATFTRVVLCAGTMTDYLEIVRRTLGTTNYGSNQAPEEFQVVIDFLGYLENSRPTSRFDGVNTQNSETHVAYTPFDDTVFELDMNSLFMRYDSYGRDRFFKMLQVEDYHEQGEYIALYLKETGFADITAAEV